MDDQSPLSELCGVCYIEKPKYRCPGCKAQTCSLGCYKRHQQRASCSGKRDPGAYLKKNQLATPSGMDQDYNYLKGVERSINHAGQDTHERGIGVRSAASRNVARGWRADSTLQRYLTENRITIDRAPTGMSRQKNNKTRPTKSNRIVWTIEWINAIGAGFTHHDCAESDTISSLYNEHRRINEAGRPKASKRKAEIEQSHALKLPKHEDLEADVADLPLGNLEQAGNTARNGASSASITQPETDATVLDQPAMHVALPDTDRTEPVKPEAAPDVVHLDSTQPDMHSPEYSLPEDVQNAAPAGRHQGQAEGSTHTDTVDSVPAKSVVHFYLLKPATSHSKVLIHLDSQTALTDCLRDQIVQEYPTIVVLDCPPQALSKGYILYEDYKKSGIETEVRPGRTSNNPTPVSHHAEVEVLPEELNPQSILEMLKRDVRT